MTDYAVRKSTRLGFWNTLRRALPGWKTEEPNRFTGDQLNFYHPDGHRLFFQVPRRRFGLVIKGEFNTDLYWNGGSEGAFHGPGCMKRLENTVEEVLASYNLHGSARARAVCPDKGTCHHNCINSGSCWRVAACAPLSGVFPGDEWPPAAQRAQKLEQMKTWLRDERRLKSGCDYAITHKYGLTRVFCDEVFAETIREAAEQFNISLHTLQTYKGIS